MSSARPTQEEFAETRKKVLGILDSHLSRQEKLERLEDEVGKEEMARLIRDQDRDLRELRGELFGLRVIVIEICKTVGALGETAERIRNRLAVATKKT